jgi:hypothetical protein
MPALKAHTCCLPLLAEPHQKPLGFFAAGPALPAELCLPAEKACPEGEWLNTFPGGPAHC